MVKKVNWKVIIQSILALAFLAMTFLVNWLFMIPVGILIWLNQRELLKNP